MKILLIISISLISISRALKINLSTRCQLLRQARSHVVATFFSFQVLKEASAAKNEPILEVLVQRDESQPIVPDEDSVLFLKVLDDGQNTVAGAKVSYDKLILPAVLQLFPVNMANGKDWKNYASQSFSIVVDVKNREGKIILKGDGESKFLESFGDFDITPMRLPSFVVLEKQDSNR